MDVRADSNSRSAPRPEIGVAAARSPWQILKGVWGRHKDLLRNAISLVATTGLTSGFGFFYWNVAARLFSQDAVGYAAAGVSVLTLLSSIGIFGFGTLMLGELPKRKDRAGLISAAMVASGLGSLVLALTFALVAPHFTTHFDDITGSIGRVSLLCVGVALTSMSLVFDQSTIGLMRGGLQLTRNITFVLVKMLTMIAVAIALHSALGIGIIASWVAAIPLSLVPVAIRLWLHHEPVLPRPDWSLLRGRVKVLLTHNWLNLAIETPGLTLPVIVASIVPPSVNAGFYVACSMTGALFILPTHLATVLFAVGSGDPRAIARKLRFTLRLSFLLGLPGVVVLGLGAHLILSFFGHGYARVAAVPMEIIAFNYIPAVPNYFYIAVCRAVGKLSRAAAVLTTFTVLDVAAEVAGCLRWGLVGLAVAGLLVNVIEASVTTPAVIRAAVGYGRHRRAAPQGSLATVDGDRRRQALVADPDGLWEQEQQEMAMALLLSLSRPVPNAATAVGRSSRALTEEIPAVRVS
jgi:O-antigen/teichoic acid export membrane protein